MNILVVEEVRMQLYRTTMSFADTFKNSDRTPLDPNNPEHDCLEIWPSEMTRDDLLKILGYQNGDTKKLLRFLQTKQVQKGWGFYQLEYNPKRTQSEPNMTSIIERVMVRIVVGADDFRNIHRGYTTSGGLTLSDLFVYFIVQMIAGNIQKYGFWVTGQRDPFVYAKFFYAVLEYLRFEAAQGVDVMALDPETGKIRLVQAEPSKAVIRLKPRLEPKMKSLLYLR
jgi:hypothetical protein